MYVSFFCKKFSFRYTIFILFFSLFFKSSLGQTTFTESAASYNLNISGNKDGGHAWADYDLDGDYDIFINTNNRGYLLRNDGGNFTDVTNTLISDVNNDGLERSALFVDFNNDSYPDIFRNDSGNARIYLQIPNTNPNNIRFGLSNGTQPNQTFNDGNFGNEFNSEGAGALDYDGDGDLDIFIDNHNYGIDILQNDGNGFFTHVTAKPPGYDVNDSSTWPLGLVQDATDGDYGSATDFNDDGWVDIVARKQDQVDLFTNIGGSFQDGVDIDQAANNNKGSVAFGDLDNDGDFDLYWTENGINQVHQNNGDGTWTGLGTATGIPINFSNQIEGLAMGDVDNDGDIDIFLTGNNVSQLYLNQINNGGNPMTFLDSGLSFNNRGEGCTFIDIDTDGDLDLYINRNGSNSLYINNLGVSARANHLYIDIKENRDEFGLTGTEERFGIGATAKILDCAGNVISGTREVNGGFGHGTMEPGVIHFGLPDGPDNPIVLEIGYPRTPTGRVVVRSQITPSDFNNGSINLVNLLPDTSNLSPIAQDDNINTSSNVGVTFDALIDNGNGVDSDPESSALEILSITQPTHGSAVLNLDGTITYNPGNFFGTTSFTYTIGDNVICSFASGQDTATVFLTVSESLDSDGDGVSDNIDLDDDNDGILDAEEAGFSVLWVTQNTAGAEEQNVIDKLTALGYTVTVVDDGVGGNANDYSVTFIYEDSNSGTAFANVANMTTTSNGIITSENALHDELLGANSGLSSTNNLIDIINNSHPITTGLSLGDYDIGDGAFHANSLASGTVLGRHPNGEVNMAIWEEGDVLDTGVASGRRAIVPHTNGNGGFNAAGEDLLVNAIIWTAGRDTDKDGIDNYLDLDSDNDGIYDAIEANHGQTQVIGRITGNVGSDGVPDNVQAAGQEDSGTVNYTLQNSDSSLDRDYVDTDSDADGCNDANEAYNDDNADSDNNGTYGFGLPTVNADGTVIGASYTTPVDNDSNAVFDFIEAGGAPSISIQPVDTNVCPGCVTTMTITASADTYQWQIFNGSNWDNLNDSGIYSGTSTDTLTITDPAANDNNNRYRVITSNSSFVCENEISDEAELFIQVGTVITNRRITYRVKKN
ncbi:FG-GAP-like repeat-containing protein [Maribacter sp. R77961]|uniref:FG-GAP-like repeat-containing protein n=1 Tax=Maribacter sp. R77961 TaxID=3093871 RepID=UPI0037CC0D9F